MSQLLRNSTEANTGNTQQRSTDRCNGSPNRSPLRWVYMRAFYNLSHEFNDQEIHVSLPIGEVGAQEVWSRNLEVGTLERVQSLPFILPHYPIKGAILHRVLKNNDNGQGSDPLNLLSSLYCASLRISSVSAVTHWCDLNINGPTLSIHLYQQPAWFQR